MIRMTAIVSSISGLLPWFPAVPAAPGVLGSNTCATDEAVSFGRVYREVLLSLLLLTVCVPVARAQSTDEAQQQSNARSGSLGVSLGRFLAGSATGLVTHESGHLLLDVVFDADPGIRKVDFHGIPFFAITHRGGLPRHREFLISSAGFWVQHAETEWLLTRRPNLRHERAPFAKGVLAFDVLTSMAYAGAAFARTGLSERDTRGMAASSRVDERWIGALVLAPAILDAWRYFHPGSKWAARGSRGVKIGLVLLVAR